ncbi:Fe-S-containing protein [Sporohalobacter salinus]|uniref:Fe-S-containing protein n=1 Tax=Sporohalobacter salinus TaxID=1494606 RepID=UPI001960D649|nr:Fe-S-containing protein [Sporohalobacter salinus]MBM7624736.1 putative membrane protein [Sporohalobacter salinus]
MLETLIMTLKYGLELAILSGVLFGFIYKTKQKKLSLYGYGSLGLALLFSILLAYSMVNLRIEKELKTLLSFTGFILTVIMIGWIWRQKVIYQSISNTEDKLSRSSSFLSKVIIFIFGLYLGIKFETELLLFPTRITVDSMLTTGFNTELLLKYVGGVLGIVLAVGFTVVLIKAHKKMTVKQSRNLAILTYIVNLLRLGILSFYGLMIKDIIEVTPELISKLAPFYNNIDYFFYLLLAVIVIQLLINAFRKKDLTTTEGLNPAQLRKVKAKFRNKERWAKAGVFMVSFLILLLGVNYIYANQSVKLTPAVKLEPSNGQFSIKKADLADGKLHRYSYQTEDGTVIEFFLIKKAEDAYGVVYDACEICGAAGYYQRENKVICKRCDVVMNKMTIGFPGGCNPIPMEYSTDKNSIQIEVDELVKRKEIFK